MIHCHNKLAATSKTRACPRRASRHSFQSQSQNTQQPFIFHPAKMSSSTTSATAVPTAGVPAMPSAESNPRVVVTAHAKDGTSIFGGDKEVQLFRPFGPNGSSFAVFDIRGSVPVNNLDLDPTASFENTLPRCPPNGIIFCITNIPAGGAAPMHRTQSLDYAVVMTGEIVLKLDNGEEKTVKAGEFIVQGGVNHALINRTAETCRIACFMVSAEKIKLEDGTELGETVFKK